MSSLGNKRNPILQCANLDESFMFTSFVKMKGKKCLRASRVKYGNISFFKPFTEKVK